MKKPFLFLIICIISLVSLGFTAEPTKMENTGLYTLIQKPSITVIGIACKTSNDPNAGSVDIPQHWAKFCSGNLIDQIPNKVSDEVVALYCDYEGDYTKPYTFLIGCQTTSLDSIPEGMVGKTLPASSYAMFRAVGEHPISLINMWGTIWQTRLERSYTGDYEIYGKRFLAETPKEVNVFIAIK